ncbi:helix-turn-helix transcriptional regulator [Saccharophagus degradans]|uniref:Helix-turn-helix domain-containing protein n=1 Tax=Saccharophagus degradans TaxID=86304 RepID=A0AAW7X7L9_9GAMM|nr:helix-turn-helix domain-containing protein [Saccharophagus degradans]MBU2986177.1 helix-turn-helix transcriptional regulator [Saccharophagus degradans]MDO6423663.1 helix-turn-helix domain-containing protein [Saccharophagus degradans]MDO6607666.1 helix-turn-helix domain-containing protein [Saccharophagus degradans]WGO99025.1 helix-turn-helix domain-containing protein [Saccharophagus degradans]
MKQTQQLLDTLKQQLRAQGKTYRCLAAHLALSEASVKRLFSERTFTLERLEQACDFIGLDIGELAVLSRAAQARLQALTRAQEAEIAEDTALLLVAISVINGFSFNDLLDYYALSEQECIRKLAHLDRLKLIDLLPGNRIRLRVAPNFSWLADGPIQRFFQLKVQQEFFNSRFNADTENLMVLNGVLSRASNQKLQTLMGKMYQEFNQLMKDDAALPMADRKGNTLVLALRQWQYPLFKQYMK